ncbi:SDR family NAD(P)-dependent oxidoreductase [Rhizobium leguminosarum]|uniref:SDR family NAD(P)-dependent oxidoreductase n=1 Tax=Rhizobium leguminosarum TaxID=384 RepID=A0A444I7K7_RHILE|nr:SDR family NAD(P)-dependent oxidoreductase [Rhizobium leguminosarum]RWX34445.1 SDR family NAD(P)-dependent oxidoreductase [Rhizobium leguminosarum]
MSDTKVWFITGASRGLGRTWAEAALDRGDKVVAAVRDLNSVSELRDRYGENVLPVNLDVKDRGQAFHSIRQSVDRFGRIDVLVCNAGYCLTGALEEVAEPDVRALFDTNVLGALWVIQAALPVMREQMSGHVIAVSSVSGLIGQETIGIYNASKWALEGMIESLAAEVSGLGVKVSILEPAIYATEFASPASISHSAVSSVYDAARARLYATLGTEHINDPKSSVGPLFTLVDSENPQLRLLLGESALGWAIRSHADRLRSWVG